MTPEEYIQAVLKTESLNDPFDSLILSRLLHSSMGCATEAGEFADSVKCLIFYDKVLDVTNVKEEIGDILWYVALGIVASGSSFEEVMEMNIAKLKKRYPEKFTSEDALNRDLDAE
ncbi:MAG: nucleoside triphosphate pyrophosphohydrolase family protein, partial [Candidatus Hodarchaeales archaeon]